MAPAGNRIRRAIVCGDRDWSDVDTLYTSLDQAKITVLIEGEAKGADRMSRMWAQSRGIEVLAFPAQWDKYGRAAGPIRNRQMLTEGQPQLVIAFHENIRQSKGTKDMITASLGGGIQVWLIKKGWKQHFVSLQHFKDFINPSQKGFFT